MNVPALKAYILARACETSTWRGVIFVATGFGAAISPDLGQSIITIGVVLAGAVGAAFPDQKVQP